MKKRLISLLLFLLCTIEVISQDWSYRIGPDTLKNKSYYAYLWIPSSANSGIRGLIMTPQIFSEWQFVRSPEIRKVAEKQKLAIVYFYPSRISIMNAQDTLYLQNTLDKFGVICYKGGIVPNPKWFPGSINNIPVKLKIKTDKPI